MPASAIHLSGNLPILAALLPFFLAFLIFALRWGGRRLSVWRQSFPRRECYGLFLTPLWLILSAFVLLNLRRVDLQFGPPEADSPTNLGVLVPQTAFGFPSLVLRYLATPVEGYRSVILDGDSLLFNLTFLAFALCAVLLSLDLCFRLAARSGVWPTPPPHPGKKRPRRLRVRRGETPPDGP